MYQSLRVASGPSRQRLLWSTIPTSETETTDQKADKENHPEGNLSGLAESPLMLSTLSHVVCKTFSLANCASVSSWVKRGMASSAAVRSAPRCTAFRTVSTFRLEMTPPERSLICSVPLIAQSTP